MKIKGGGYYYLISKTLGIKFGGTIRDAATEANRKAMKEKSKLIEESETAKKGLDGEPLRLFCACMWYPLNNI